MDQLVQNLKGVFLVANDIAGHWNTGLVMFFSIAIVSTVAFSSYFLLKKMRHKIAQTQTRQIRSSHLNQPFRQRTEQAAVQHRSANTDAPINPEHDASPTTVEEGAKEEAEVDTEDQNDSYPAKTRMLCLRNLIKEGDKTSARNLIRSITEELIDELLDEAEYTQDDNKSLTLYAHIDRIRSGQSTKRQLSAFILSLANDPNKIRAEQLLERYALGEDITIDLIERAKDMAQQADRKLANSLQPVRDIAFFTFVRDINETRDALSYILSSKPDDYGAMIDLAQLEYAYGSLKLSEDYYCRAIATMQKQDKPVKDLGRVLGELGLLYESQDKYELARQNYEDALNLHLKTNSICDQVLDYTRLGNLCAVAGLLAQASQYFRHALNLEELRKNQNGIARQCSNLGIVSQMRGALQESAAYYGRALEIDRITDNRVHLAHDFASLGQIHRLRHNFDQAINLWKKARTIYKQCGQHLMADTTLQWIKAANDANIEEEASIQDVHSDARKLAS